MIRRAFTTVTTYTGSDAKKGHQSGRGPDQAGTGDAGRGGWRLRVSRRLVRATHLPGQPIARPGTRLGCPGARPVYAAAARSAGP